MSELMTITPSRYLGTFFQSLYHYLNTAYFHWFTFFSYPELLTLNLFTIYKIAPKRLLYRCSYSNHPFQVIDSSHYDYGWKSKSFTKWFKKTPEIHYRGDWPRDLIYKGEMCLYWRRSHTTVKVETPFFHLSYIKGHSFRDEKWSGAFRHNIGKRVKIPGKYREDMEIIYDQFNKVR